MSLVGKVGRKRWRARLAMTLVYSILILGAVTTLYPFLLMLSTGFKGPTDQNDNRLIPAYFSDTNQLLAKYVDDKYGDNPSAIASSRIGGLGSPNSIAQYRAFLQTLPLNYWVAGFRNPPNGVTGRLQKRYTEWLRTHYRRIDDLNVAYGEESVDFQTVAPPVELSDRKTWHLEPTRKNREWLQFKADLPVEFRIPVRAQRLFQEWLRGHFQGEFAAVPKEVAGTAKAFESVLLPTSGPLLTQFRKESLPASYASKTSEQLWARLSSSPMPIEADEAAWVAANGSTVRSEFATRNYAYVLDYVLLNGRAVWNTIVFCGLAILTQLIVNPLAAYALSRYPIRASGAILMFLLATMAFPAEVAAIPSFLLLKDLGLLNTFAALVLPTAASGYMIFLLKGFFDSLPQELFEAGSIDGAKELTMMFRIALPLSRPVLGYLALTAFMGAYGAFLYAFLVAQDQKLWTLMVWIYQLQVLSPKSVIMAALTLAALPTLLVFLLAQRVIMRGIVLPGER
jgi:multiple sugar transport system permease protein